MTSRIGTKGFTLLEVLVASTVLSLGVVFIYEAFFISLDSFDYCRNYLKVANFADEKIWETQDTISRLGASAKIARNGAFNLDGKNFTWDLSCGVIDESAQLYRINLVVAWQSGKRKARIIRDAYAAHNIEN